ncbi:MAG: TonB-dependent receptor, partial [Sphingobacteriia bacterium]
GESFSDANNTQVPTTNGNNGLVPSYVINDLSAQYLLAPLTTLRAGVNNLFQATYFTRRAGGYPGPGLLPGDGRTFFLSLAFKL